MKRIDFYSKSIIGKMLSIFLVAAMSVGISWGLSHISFKRVVESIEEISKPSEKIHLINKLSYSFSNIIQFQRQQFIEGANDNDTYLDNQFLVKTLDTLRNYSKDNDFLLQKIDSMGNIIESYDSLLSNYLRVYEEFTDVQNLSSKYHSLTDYFSVIANEIDSSVITTETKKTTTTVFPGETRKRSENNPSFFHRLLGQGNSENPEDPQVSSPPEKIIEEEFIIRIDTLSIAQRTKIAKEFQESINKIDNYHRIKSRELANSELSLFNFTNIYINQLRDLLHAVEEEEINKITANNAVLVETVNQSMLKITFIMILFVVLSTLLAFMVFSDIARSNQYRKELTRAKEEAEHLSMVKQRFLSNMSHEIRTPLQSIVGFSEQIVQQRNPNREAIRVIYNSSKHLIQIVNEVLDYSRIISGKFTFDPVEFKMNDLLNEVAETMKFQSSRKGLRFQFNNNIDPNKYFSGDTFRLKQILFNLLGNAIKFTEEGSVGLKVSAIANAGSTEFVFQIDDTGIGLSEKNLKVIFNEFEQAKASGQNNSNGTGLGLSIAKSLIELQGGNITASSVLGQGSSFIFNIKYENINKPNSLSPGTPAVKKPSFKGKVMVIDDDVFILKLCSDIFKKFNISHYCFSSPIEALKKWDKNISIILIDIRMPEMNGFELFALLRERGEGDLKIIALSAQTLPEEREAIMGHGFDNFLMKPFKEHELLSVINNLILPEEYDKPTYNTSTLKGSPLVKMSLGDNVLLLDNLKTFLTETKKDKKYLQKYIEQKKINEIQEILHKLAGRFGQIGATSFSVKLRSFEKEVREMNGHFLENDSTYHAIINEMESLIEIVERELIA